MMKCDDTALIALLDTDDAHSEASEKLAQVTRHVDSCTLCQNRLSELAGDATQWDETERWLSPTDLSPEEYAESVETRQRSSGQISWSESAMKSLLSDAFHPEMLGRIGRYDVERLIGSGGMGVVFKAYDTELNRPVAV